MDIKSIIKNAIANKVRETKTSPKDFQAKYGFSQDELRNALRLQKEAAAKHEKARERGEMPARSGPGRNPEGWRKAQQRAGRTPTRGQGGNFYDSVTNLSDYLTYLTETIKVKIEELSIETLKSYKSKAEAQTGTTSDKRQKGINTAKYKIARKEMGLDRDPDNETHNRERNLSTHKGPGSPEGRERSDTEEADAASRRTGAMPIDKINRMGVRKGNPNFVTRTGLTVGDALASRSNLKSAARDIQTSAKLRKLGDK